MKKIILVGAGGHAKSCLDIIKSTKKYRILGFIDNDKSKTIDKYKVIGGDNYLKNIKNKKNINIAITIGQIKNYKKRNELFLKIKRLGFKIPKIVSRHALISDKSSILTGTMIFHGVIINYGVKVGENSIINTSALIEHDTKIGSNTHIATKATINGGVKIGSNTFIGSGSVIKEGVEIRDNCIIGMGSIIKKDVKNNSLIK